MRFSIILGVVAISLASAALAQTVTPAAMPQNSATDPSAGAPPMQGDPYANTSDNAADPSRPHKKGKNSGAATTTPDDPLSRPGSSAGTVPPPR